MKSFSKNMTIPDIIDVICDLEGYIEHLDYRISNNRDAFIKKQNYDKRRQAKIKLEKYKRLLDLKSAKNI